MSNLVLTQAALAAPKDLKGVFDLEPFKNNFVKNLVKTTVGKTEEAAEMQFEREKILFMKAIQANKELEKCDRFTIYSAFIELAVSGVSLNEGESYIIPYGGKAAFQIGYKGRVKQMQEIPGFAYVNMPQVVYTNDVFDYELGEEPRILKHKPVKRQPGDELEFVYMVIETANDKKKTFIMTREQVHNIRDHYSTPYIQYVAEVAKQGKKIGDPVVKKMKGKDGRPDWDLTIQPPMWITSPEEAWKKTICKRAYKWVPKTPKLRALDAKIAANPDPEDGTQGDENTFTIDYGIENGDGTTTEVKANTTESTAAAPKKEKEKKTTAAPKTPATAPAPEAPKTTVSTADLDDMSNMNTSDEPTQDVEHTEVNDEEAGSPAAQTPDIGDPLKGF